MDKLRTGAASPAVCVKKKSKEIFGYDSEELEVLTKEAKFEFFGDSSESDPLSGALKRLSLCKANRDSCEGFPDRGKEVADNRVSLAEDLLHAEILLELVRTRNKLKMVNYALKCTDGDMTKLLNQIAKMEREAK